MTFRTPRPATMIGLTLVALALAAAIAGAMATPFDPIEPDLTARLAAPSHTHWMGTDQFGRDVLSRLLAGAISSLSVSAGAVSVALLAGTIAGMAAGYFGGWLDRLIALLTESVMAFPGILLALAIMAVAGPGELGLVLALGIALAPFAVRVARTSTLSIRASQYVEASWAMGNSDFRTLLLHVVPNCAPQIMTLATSLFGIALLAESALSFLGLGVAPPQPTWGGMLADARTYIDKAVWLAIFPGLAISLSLLGINLVGDAVRDRLDPRS